MDINMQRTPVDEPVYDLHQETLWSIVLELKKTHIQQDDPVDNNKSLLNSAFKIAQVKLYSNLKKGNSASWLLEAYKQTFMWTGVYRGLPFTSFSSPKEVAPLGRLGWRFVIEHILSGGTGDSLQRRTPNAHEVVKVFTILSVMAMSAEWSNLIHFFPDIYGGVEFDLSEPHGILTPVLPKDADLALIKRANYMQKSEQELWSELISDRQIADEKVLNEKLSNALKKAKGFGVEDVRSVVDVLTEEVLSSGIVLIIPGEYLVDWISDEGNIPKALVNKILNFMLLSPEAFGGQSGDFLNKKNPVRMINYAGIKLDKVKYLSSIYPKASLNKAHIKKASWHVIINIFMVGEWLDTFNHRSAIGQRPDLKKDPEFNLALEDIEQYHRRTIFEDVVLSIFQKSGFRGFKSLKKWPNENGTSVALPCGEIDVLSYDFTANTLFVVECKASAPAVDSRGQSQQYKEHFVQKKYHNKFLAKIEWVKDNIAQLSKHRDLQIDAQSLLSLKIKPLMVTRYPSIVKFYVAEYDVLTFGELYEFLQNKTIS
ncbi:hypothetical protein ACI2KD_11670 [Pseudomonas monteilii]